MEAASLLPHDGLGGIGRLANRVDPVEQLVGNVRLPDGAASMCDGEQGRHVLDRTELCQTISGGDGAQEQPLASGDADVGTEANAFELEVCGGIEIGAVESLVASSNRFTEPRASARSMYAFARCRAVPRVSISLTAAHAGSRRPGPSAFATRWTRAWRPRPPAGPPGARRDRPSPALAPCSARRARAGPGELLLALCQ